MTQTQPSDGLPELLPCPFCGEPAKARFAHGEYWITCTRTGVCFGNQSAHAKDRDGHYMHGFTFYKDAAEHWNTRTAIAASAVPAWLPIESAPRDGTRVLLKADSTYVAGWTEGGNPKGKSWVIVNDCWIPDHIVTGWQPLPAAPEPDSNE